MRRKKLPLRITETSSKEEIPQVVIQIISGPNIDRKETVREKKNMYVRFKYILHFNKKN